jgi:phytanoyl-CoA hydroxylase
MTLAERPALETSNSSHTSSASNEAALQTAIEQSIVQLTKERADRYVVSVDEYVTFRRDGFLIVRGLYTPAEVAELRDHADDLMNGRLPEQQGMATLNADGTIADGTAQQELAPPPAHLTPEQKAEFWLRIHMLHRKLALHEKHLLHPRVLDVLEALIGPDVAALQTMLFLKGPGKPGQGFHQDSYYIPTYPDSLCGAWVAIDDVDEENGCMFFTPGSGHEPVYPAEGGGAFGDGGLAGIKYIKGASETDDEKNDLYPIWKRKYNHEVAAVMKAGDVAFFNGHVLHRSHTNRSKTRFRRSFVGHYCNARAYTDWCAGIEVDSDNPYAPTAVDKATGSTNGSTILARGDTHMPFGKPRFLTPCAALVPDHIRKMHRRPGVSMMGMPSGEMKASTHGSQEEHDQAHEKEAAGGMK